MPVVFTAAFSFSVLCYHQWCALLTKRALVTPFTSFPNTCFLTFLVIDIEGLNSIGKATCLLKKFNKKCAHQSLNNFCFFGQTIFCASSLLCPTGCGNFFLPLDALLMSFFHSHQISNRNLHSPSNCYLQSSSKALVKWPML